MAGVGNELTSENYTKDDYFLLFNSLQYLCELEDRMYVENDWGPDEYT